MATRQYDAYLTQLERETALEQREDDAIDFLRAYVNVTTPNLAQTAGVVKVLCRITIWRWRLKRNQVDGTD